MSSVGGAGAGPSTGPSAQPTKKRRNNVGKACENCRRRRVKCDGIRPCCGTCKVYKDECAWDAREDHRKPLSRQQAQALEARVADLERLLRDHGLDPGQAAGPSGTKAEDRSWEDDRPRKEEDQSSVGSVDVREWSQDHLVEGETGDYQVYGPTSAFRHLGRYSHEGTQGSLLNHAQSPESVADQLDGFRRYLPRDVHLTEAQHKTALNRFFRYYASWAQRTHPILFFEDMEAALSGGGSVKTSHFSPMLHNAILAIGLCFCEEPYLRTPAIRRTFAQEAKTHLEREGMNPTVATVQALAHLASYHSLAAEHNLGWLYIGMALRCAMALGLNMDASKMIKRGSLTAAQARERNVTYFTTWIQEGLWAPYIGRPIQSPDTTAGPPTVDVELDNVVWTYPDAPERESEYLIKPQPCLVSSTFVETVKLMEIGGRIMNTLYGLKTEMAVLARTGVVSEISLALSTWLENLPQPLVLHPHSAKNAMPHILMMHLSWAWLVILLHRPFYRPLASMASRAEEGAAPTGYGAALAVKHCDRAANQIITLLQLWHKLHDLRFTPPTALQCCFVAGTTHLLSFASCRTSKKQAEALAKAKECIRLLSCMAVSWPAARQKQTLLEDLLQDYGASINGSAKDRSEITSRIISPGGPGRSILLDATRGGSTKSEQSSVSPQTSNDRTDSKPFETDDLASSLPVHMQTASAAHPGLPMPSNPDPASFPVQPNLQLLSNFSMLDNLDPSPGMGGMDMYAPAQALPMQDYDLRFGNYDFGLASGDLQSFDQDYFPHDMAYGNATFAPDNQAVFDNLVQPHLHVGVPAQLVANRPHQQQQQPPQQQQMLPAAGPYHSPMSQQPWQQPGQ